LRVVGLLLAKGLPTWNRNQEPNVITTELKSYTVLQIRKKSYSFLELLP
jgi:hypothetical protein